MSATAPRLVYLGAVTPMRLDTPATNIDHHTLRAVRYIHTTPPHDPKPAQPPSDILATLDDPLGFFKPRVARASASASTALQTAFAAAAAPVATVGARRIGANTTITYSTAQRAWLAFASHASLPVSDVDNTDPGALGQLGQCFAHYLHTQRNLAAGTVDSYLSGVITSLTIAGVAHAHLLRSAEVSSFIAGLRQDDAKSTQARLKQTIPAYFVVIQAAMDLVPAIVHPSKVCQMRAMILLSWACGLRAKEGASGDLDSDTDHHHATAGMVAFRFDLPDGSLDPAFYMLTADGIIAKLRSTPPSGIAFMLKHNKTMGTGHHKPRRGEALRATYANATPGALPHHCPVLSTAAYVIEAADHRPWTPALNLFSLTAAEGSVVLKAVARLHGLDDTRLTMRSLRPGSTCMLDGLAGVVHDAANSAIVAGHGGWQSNTGEHIYQDRLLTKAKALALYTTGQYTFEHLRFLYMPAPGDLPVQQQHRKRHLG